ncbi:TlyA family rRNA (cytidine-2'-O)-methyltransferase [Hahella sp. CCB-MM4]|uniref:TlyA family RNA methyltransferase n=1 Tax=Hahella sp. (strain CCB-MM4) TaxID=1926491 RepID=UPI000B9AEC45|nr:TlyA family RNA methyltransferase [Hahella sp. CCB-MM4]OZG73528.1 TlyA family rRNA (cytidine-2'-O)-methyltransferase [Hahella sp. CCB-MM4]
MKYRLDKYLVDKGLCRSRNQAQELITQGAVEIQIGKDWQKAGKASQTLPEGTPLRIVDNELQRFVSRGALKLAGALDRIQNKLNESGLETWDFSRLSAVDVGQSTGGFTHVLLDRGIASVTGVEVGHDQLVEEIRDNPRVSVYEGVNAKHLASWFKSELEEHPGFDLAVMDVSFISQTLILPELAKILKPGGKLVSLVKPQFEVGPEGLGKGGLVNNPGLYPEVEKALKECCKTSGLDVIDYFDSPIKGGDGNREFFIYARRRKTSQ